MEALMVAFNKRIATEFEKKLGLGLSASESNQLTPQQEAFITAFLAQDASILGEAVAGSGKSFILLKAALSLPRTQWTCKTMHGLGYGAWAGKLGKRLSIKDSKMFQLLKKQESVRHEDFGDVLNLARKAKIYGIIPSGAPRGKALTNDDPDTWEEIANHFDLEYSDEILFQARRLLTASILAAQEGSLDFDDMLYMPVCFYGVFTRYPLVLVDEAQDLSAIQHEMLRRTLSRNDGILVGAGDRNQCNPPGTFITTAKGKVAIENLKVGDKVISYHRDKKHLRERTVLETASRHFSGRLTRINTGGREYRATPNHRCVARLNIKYANYHAVYLMKRDNQFRIGKTLLRRNKEQEFGLALRMRQEQADAIWLLYVFKEKEEALMWEQLTASDYGLPMTCFKSSGQLAISQKRLDFMWGLIGDNSNRASHLLSNLQKDPLYPIAEKDSNNQVSFKRQSLIRACNLMEDIFEVPEEEVDYINWVSAEISHDEYDGKVYSLKVEATESTNWNGLYFADGILTGNSIYGFRGALAEGIPNLVDNFKMDLYPLTVSFRCPQAVVLEAQKDVPHIEAFSGAIQGEVIRHKSLTLETVPPVVLCRNTAPLVDLGLRLIGSGRGAKIAGRDIGKSLAKQVKKICPKPVSLEVFDKRLPIYIDAEVRRKPSRLPSLKDREAALFAISDRAFSISGGTATSATIISIIEKLYDPSAPGVHLSTIHRAKGAEWPEVLFLDPGLIPSKYATQPWQLQQETNLRYVGVTRAQKKLHFASSHIIED